LVIEIASSFACRGILAMAALNTEILIMWGAQANRKLTVHRQAALKEFFRRYEQLLITIVYIACTTMKCVVIVLSLSYITFDLSGER